MEVVCRVCLTDDYRSYSVANTTLEQTYEVISGVKLQQAGRPTSLCCVCVSQLRRCRKFAEAARESNAALDRWYRDHSYADSKPTAHPLIIYTKTTTEFVEISEPPVKQEALEDGEGAEKIKYEVTDNDSLHVLHDDIDNTQMSDCSSSDICVLSPSLCDNDNTQHVQDNIHIPNDSKNITKQGNENRPDYDGIKGYIPDVEWVNVQDYVDAEYDETQSSDDVKLEIQEVLDVVGSEDVQRSVAAGISNVEEDCSSSVQGIALRTLGSRKRINLDHDIDGPVIKQVRLTTARHHSVATDTASTHGLQQNMSSSSQCTYTNGNVTDIGQRATIHTGRKSLASDFRTNANCILNKNLLIYTGEKPFSCDAKCDFRSTHNQNLKQYLITNTGEKPFACDKCDYRCIDKSYLNRHLITHNASHQYDTGKKLFECDTCGKKYKEKYKLIRHIICKHDGKKPFACDKCDFRTNLKSKLKQHSFNHDVMLFVCRKCSYRSKLKSDLKTHLLTHSSEKPFACDTANYRSISQRGLKLHSIIHSGEKQFACDHCDYRSHRKHNLKAHLMTHMPDDKRFACSKCNYRSQHKSSVKTHLLTHSSEKPFACDTCNYRSNSRTNLNKHSIIHSGEKQFACDQCDYRSYRKHNLKAHLMTHMTMTIR